MKNKSNRNLILVGLLVIAALLIGLIYLFTSGRSRLDQAQKELDTVSSELENARSVADELSEALSEAYSQYDELDAENQKTLTAKTSLESEKESLSASKTSLESEKESLAASNSSLESEKESLAALSSSLESEKESLSAAKTSLESENAHLTSSRTSLESEKERLTAEKKELETEVTTLSETASVLQSEKDTLLAETLCLESEKTALETEKTELQTEIDALSQDRSSLESEITGLQSDKTSLESEITSLQSEKDFLTSENSSLSTGKASAESERESLLQSLSAQQASALEKESEFTLEKTQLENRITDLETVRTRVTETLEKTFNDDDISLSLEDNGVIVLNAGVLFDFNSSDLTTDGKNLLREFFASYVNILLSDEVYPYISEVIIQGHADADGSYLYNLYLAQKRAYQVAEFCVGDKNSLLSQEELDKVLPLITVNSRSYSDLLYTSEDAEEPTVDSEKSRRVEIEFRLKSNDELDHLLNP
ncbi:MAG: OmpA family protein [Lachnospiraceae bacterium]|nr:OmpA family protein [Lachnospiraceae bacterium]